MILKGQFTKSSKNFPFIGPKIDSKHRKLKVDGFGKFAAVFKTFPESCIAELSQDSVSEPRPHSSSPSSIYLDRGAMAAEKQWRRGGP